MRMYYFVFESVCVQFGFSTVFVWFGEDSRNNKYCEARAFGGVGVISENAGGR
jgi:hypothetical protein